MLLAQEVGPARGLVANGDVAAETPGRVIEQRAEDPGVHGPPVPRSARKRPAGETSKVASDSQASSTTETCPLERSRIVNFRSARPGLRWTKTLGPFT